MMQEVDTLGIAFRERAQMRHFEALAARDMSLTFYPDGPTMTTLKIRDNVIFLLNQIGWDTSPLRRRFSSYHRLTLEFLSSLDFLPNHGLGFNRGLTIFRMFGIEYQYTIVSLLIC